MRTPNFSIEYVQKILKYFFVDEKFNSKLIVKMLALGIS